MKRKPPVYLIVILPTMLFGGLALIITLCLMYSRLTGVPRSAIPNLNGLLISLPALFLWMPTSLLISNLIIYCVPQLRQVAEQYVQKSESPGYFQSQRMLVMVCSVFAVICVPLIILGFVL